MSLTSLKFDCRFKMINLESATEYVTGSNFATRRPVENYIQCLKESLASAEELLFALATEEQAHAEEGQQKNV